MTTQEKQQTDITVPGEALEYYGTKRVKAWDIDENTKGVQYEDGYISKSPRGVFEKAYETTNAMSFKHALAAMDDGYKVYRSGWETEHKTGWTYIALEDGLSGYGYYVHLNNGNISPWGCDQSDMFGKDWGIRV